MLKSILAATLGLMILPAASFAAPKPSIDEIYQACTQNRAETLPNPFVDVSPQDWAYKAVLTMHYCGAFRQAAPRSLFDRTNAKPAPQASTNEKQRDR
jgi:hypothetical protein